MVYCAKCGKYAEARARDLLKPCPGQKRERWARKRIAAGRHPTEPKTRVTKHAPILGKRREELVKQAKITEQTKWGLEARVWREEAHPKEGREQRECGCRQLV